MAKKRKKATEAQILALNGGVEAVERHELVQRRLAAQVAKFQRRIDERAAREAEQAS